jgi:diguanylate cyclase (GGDEF)-like protein
VGGIVISARDVSERKNLLDSLHHQAHHDSLTSLPNRVLLIDRLEQALHRAARHETPVAVLFLDLDGFKAVNDQIGHSGGDQLLIAVAERLRAALRADDTLARLGGDEFVVVLEECDQTLAMRMADRLIASLGDITIEGRRFDIAASVGIAMAAGPGNSIDDLLHQSDVAMYRAKSNPNQSVSLFAEDYAGTLPMAGD